MTDDTLEIRSYRVCFALERRIHKIDRWRIPLPYGLPLRGLGYGIAALVAVLILRSFPIFGALLGTLHPAVRYAVLPVALAVMLTRWFVDGRPAHDAAAAWLRLKLEPRRMAAFRPAPAAGPVRLAEIPMAPDESGARLRKGVIEGPCTVVLRYPMRAQARGRALHIAQETGPALWRGKQVRLAERQRIVIA